MARRKKEKKAPIGERVMDALDMPKDVLLDLSKITIMDYRDITIENYQGIIEYESEKIRVNTKTVIVEIGGCDLDISSITDEEITISGCISSVAFVK